MKPSVAGSLACQFQSLVPKDPHGPSGEVRSLVVLCDIIGHMAQAHNRSERLPSDQQLRGKLSFLYAFSHSNNMK